MYFRKDQSKTRDFTYVELWQKIVDKKELNVPNLTDTKIFVYT